MPGLGPQRRRTLASALRKNGLSEYEGRGKGSHTWWEHPDNPSLCAAMPGKAEIRAGTARQILEDTGKTVEHYLDVIG